MSGAVLAPVLGPLTSRYLQQKSSTSYLQHRTAIIPTIKLYGPFPGLHSRSNYAWHLAALSPISLGSIQDFIRGECPLPGLDGHFREQSRDAEIECSCVQMEIDELVCPGSRLLLPLSEAHLEQVVQDGGQLVLAPMEGSSNGSVDSGGSSPRTVIAPPRGGSYACLAQVLGVQRIPSQQRAVVRCAVSERVAVQAVSDPPDAATPRVRAAVLRDRWACFARADALWEGNVGGSSDGGGKAGGAAAASASRRRSPQAAAALLSVEGAAEDLCLALQGLLRVLSSSNASGGSGGGLLGAQGAAQELRQILEEAWGSSEEEAEEGGGGTSQEEQGGTAAAAAPRGPDGEEGGGGIGQEEEEGGGSAAAAAPAGPNAAASAASGPDAAALAGDPDALWALSFAPFAARSAAAACGVGTDEHLARVRRALEACDIGMRLDIGAEYAQELLARASAISAASPTQPPTS